MFKTEGQILWDKAQVITGQNATNNGQVSKGYSLYDSVVILPFVYQNQKQVSAFLACGIKGGSLYFKLHRARMYSKYKFAMANDSLTANAMALEFMFLDKAVFGDSVFQVTDKRLFNLKKSSSIKTVRIKAQTTPLATADWITFTQSRCYSISDDGNQGQVQAGGVVSGGTPNYPTTGWICYSQNMSISITGGAPSGETAVGTDPYGTSGGGAPYDPNSPNHWWWSNEPCPDPNGWQEPDAPQCNGGTVLGWQPLYPFFEVTSDQNPFATPCLYTAKQRIGDVTLNVFSKNLLWTNTKNQMSNWKLIFGEMPHLTIAGNTVPAYSQINAPLQVVFITMNTAYFDGTYSPNSSQEWATSVMLHEILHAFLFVYKDAHGIVDFGSIGHHEIMFKNFVIVVKQTLMNLFPNLSETDATALAIGGMWDALTKTGTSILRADMDQFSITNYNISLASAAATIHAYEKGLLGTKCF